MTPSPPAHRRADLSAEDILGSLNQPMPWSDESEKSVLSALLQEPGRLRNARQRIRPEAFYSQSNRLIYVELMTMEEAGLPLEPVLLTNRLRDQHRLDLAGGPGAVMDIFTFIPSAAHYEHYMADLAGRWRLRQAIHGYAKGLHAIQAAFSQGTVDTSADGVRGLLNLAGQTVQGFLGDFTPSGETSATLKTCLQEHLDYMAQLTERLQAGASPLVPTGIPTLDSVCGGIGEDEYWLVTGPTKSGKSVLTGNIIVNAAYRGVKGKVYTNEVGRRSYAGRILASRAERLTAGMDRHGLKTRQEQEEYARLQKEVSQAIGDRIIIDNAAGKYVEDIIADLRTEVDAGVRLFVVDLIGKIRTRERFGSREQEIAHISGSLCNATKTYGVPIIVVSQENEEGQVRESRSLAFDCEAWLRLKHVTTKPEKGKGGFGSQAAGKGEVIQDRRELVIELARGFQSGDKIPCIFDGPHYRLREMKKEEFNQRDWTEDM